MADVDANPEINVILKEARGPTIFMCFVDNIESIVEKPSID